MRAIVIAATPHVSMKRAAAPLYEAKINAVNGGEAAVELHLERERAYWTRYNVDPRFRTHCPLTHFYQDW